MDNMFGSLEEMFDLNDDGKIDPIEFGIMMEVIETESQDDDNE